MSVNPKEINSQLSFWRRYGPWLVGSAVAGAAAFYALSSGSSSSEAPKKQDKRLTQLKLPYRDTSGATELKSHELGNKLTLDDVDWDGKRVLIRTDYNVQLSRNGAIADTTRIDQSIPTLKRLLEKKGPKGGVKCIVIITHLGRPSGNYDKADYSLQPLVHYLRECLGQNTPVEFLPDCVGPSIIARTHSCVPGTVFLCENLRFHIEEIGTGILDGKEVKASLSDIAEFRKQLSQLGDLFVFEAFGAAHRPHSSVVGIDIPLRCSGLHMGREMLTYSRLLAPRPPIDDNNSNNNNNNNILSSTSHTNENTGGKGKNKGNKQNQQQQQQQQQNQDNLIRNPPLSMNTSSSSSSSSSSSTSSSTSSSSSSTSSSSLPPLPPSRISSAGVNVASDGSYLSPPSTSRQDAPFVVVIGSALKVTDKIKILERWIDHADEMIITGGMAFTFKTVLSREARLGGSLVDVDAIKEVERLVRKAHEKGFIIHLPTDHCIAETLDEHATVGVTDDDQGIPAGWLALDVGPRSRARFSDILSRAKTIVWSGTVGCYDLPPFAGGTISLLQDMVEATKRGAFTLVAGGEATTAARTFTIGKAVAADQLSFVSSGGGSSLVLMEGKQLHGAAALTSKHYDNNDADNEQ